MPFLDPEQVTAFLAETGYAAQIASAFALRCLVHTATYPADYTADPRWITAICPTEAGNELLERVSTLPIPRPDLRLALFGLFWFQEPLIDAHDSDLRLVRAIIEEEALQYRIYWPMSHGRLLYDRYGVMLPDNRDSITSSEVQRLLEGAPQGVYQVGSLVTGPLGIVDSRCVRHYPPSMRIGLWHCPMLDCGALHPVRLEPPPIPLTDSYNLLSKAAVQIWNTQSRWRSILEHWPLPYEESWKARSEMPLFLGDCIVGIDRTHLTMLALRSQYTEGFRTILKSRRPKSAHGDPEAVASSLSSEEQLQLLLTLSDTELKMFLDELVWNRDIDVPADEVRETDKSKRVLLSTFFASSLELSSLGIRSKRKPPVLLLRHLLWNAYVQNEETADLDWRLQKQPGVPTQDALMDYLRKATPPAAIETLVLTSPRVTQTVACALETSIEKPGERARALLEWKLGFDLPREP